MPEKKATTKKTTAKRATEARTPTKTLRGAKADPGPGTKAPARRTKKAEAPARAAAAATAAAQDLRVHRGRRKTKVGRVVAAKTPHTAIVEIERLREHPLYKKTIRVRKRFASHDAKGDVRAGDIVRIQESRPFSATKRWQVIEVISRAGEAFAAAPDAAEIAKALEETEGVTELLSKPEREINEAGVGQPEEDREVGDGSGTRASGASTKA